MARIIIPGIGGSGETHWQTLWERADPAMRRIRPASWDAPELEDWIEALDAAIAACAQPPILIAHSLGCLLVAHWAAHPDRPAIAGAFLVAAPDSDGPAFPKAEAASFRDPPDTPLPFPALMLASEDDPYSSPDHTRLRAGQWGAGLISIGVAGHINGASGLGDWPAGKALLTAFAAGAVAP